MRREDWLVNRKRMRRRKHIALHRGPAPVPVEQREREGWFCPWYLADGQPFRVLMVVDRALNGRPCPRSTVDQGTEFQFGTGADVREGDSTVMDGGGGPYLAARILLCLTTLRESLGFYNLRRSHPACKFI